MNPLLFWLFTTVMLGFGLGVIINRNPVASALCLVGSFLCLAALFVGLDAYFIGTIQVLVYAGAVMVLFLFIIMLLDLKTAKVRKRNWLAVGGGAAVAACFVVQLATVLARFSHGEQPFPKLPTDDLDDVREVGMMLFTNYNLPFQIVGVLVLVATIGVVVLSKRELK